MRYFAYDNVEFKVVDDKVRQNAKARKSDKARKAPRPTVIVVDEPLWYK